MLTKKVFDDNISIFTSVFGNIKVTKERLNIWYDLLNDIDDKDLCDAVRKVCREVKEVYPGTNIVALIREHIAEGDGMQVLR